MSAKQKEIEVNGLSVHIVRKPIKNIWFRLCPASGAVLISAPFQASDKLVRRLVIEKSAWLEAQRQKYEQRGPRLPPQLVNGEQHYFLGQSYHLLLVSAKGPGKIVLRADGIMELHAPADSSLGYRQNVLHNWQRWELEKIIPPLFVRWAARLEVEPKEWRIKKMKTRWGTCNTVARRIWLNLDLIQKPLACIEYVLLHELAHLIERTHNHRFVAVMDAYMPSWQIHKQELNTK